MNLLDSGTLGYFRVPSMPSVEVPVESWNLKLLEATDAR